MKRFLSIVFCVLIAFSFSGCALYDFLNFYVEKLPNPDSPLPAEGKYQNQADAVSKTELDGLIKAAESKLNGVVNENITYSWVDNYYVYGFDDYGYEAVTKSIYREIKSLPQGQRAESEPYAQFSQFYGSGDALYTHVFYDGYFVDNFSRMRYDFDDNYYQNTEHFEHELTRSSVLLGLLGFAYDNFATVNKQWENGKETYVMNLGAVDAEEIAGLISFDFSLIDAGELLSCTVEFNTKKNSTPHYASAVKLKLNFENESFTVTAGCAFSAPEFTSPSYEDSRSAYVYYLGKLLSANHKGAPKIDYKVHITDNISGREYNLYAVNKQIVGWRYEKTAVYAAELLDESDKQVFGDWVYYSEEYGIFLAKKNGALSVIEKDNSNYNAYRNLVEAGLSLSFFYDTATYSENGGTKIITFEVFNDYFYQCYTYQIENGKVTSYKNELVYEGEVALDVEYEISYEFSLALPDGIADVNYIKG